MLLQVFEGGEIARWFHQWFLGNSGILVIWRGARTSEASTPFRLANDRTPRRECVKLFGPDVAFVVLVVTQPPADLEARLPEALAASASVIGPVLDTCP